MGCVLTQRGFSLVPKVGEWTDDAHLNLAPLCI
jgi:hypothetical protein